MKETFFFLLLCSLGIFQMGEIKDFDIVNYFEKEFKLLDLSLVLGFTQTNDTLNKSNIQNYTVCKNKLEEILMNNTNDPLFRPFFTFSGLGTNDYGNFDRCKNTINFTYFLIDVFPGSIDSMIKSGVCIPNECSNDTLSLTLVNSIKSILPFLNKKFSLLFSSVIDSEAQNEKLHKYSFGYFVCIILLILYMILVIGATVRKYFIIWKSQTEENKEHSNSNNNSSLLVIIDCFNLKDNVESLMKTENKIDSKLNSWQIFRCIGMFWVIMGHSYSIGLLTTATNILQVEINLMSEKGMAFLRNATISVDIFFVLGGFLSTMALASIFENEKNRNLRNILLLYFHRYARLFPFMIIAWVLTSYLIPPIVNGVDTHLIGTYQQQCKSRFFQTFLYIDNYFVNDSEFCNGWIWYLYVDMQLFILTPFIIYPALKNINLGLITLLTLTFLSLGIQTYIFQHNHFQAGVAETGPDFMRKYYQQTYTRCNTYFLGIFFAYLHFELTGKKLFKSSFLHTINQFFKNRILRYLFNIAGIGMILFVIFAQNWFDHEDKNHPIPQYQATLYLLFYRLVFALGMLLIVYSILEGFSRPANSIFGHPFFNVLGKITYGSYMLHLIIINYICASLKNSITYEFYHKLLDTIAMYFLAYLFSFLVTIFFESPVVQLLKLLSQSQRKRSSKKPVEREISLSKDEEFKDIEEQKNNNNS